MTLGFLSGSKNFCKLLCVSCEVFVLHGYDWIHWVAKSCTTTAYRWLFRDKQPSLRTLWSAVIKSPKFSARGTAPPLRLLHGALVIFVLWQISQFRSFRGNEYKHCVYTKPHVSCMWALKTLHEKNWRESLHVQEFHHPPNFLWILAATPGFQNTDGSPRPFNNGSSRSFCGSFFIVFGVLLVWSTSGLLPDLSSTVVDHSHWRDVTFNSIISFSSLSITYCRWRRRAWGRCRMNDSPVFKVSLMLKDENWRITRWQALEPR